MLPCMSIASVRPSGDAETDIDVPSVTVTSRRVGVAAAANAAAAAETARRALRIMNAPPGTEERGLGTWGLRDLGIGDDRREMGTGLFSSPRLENRPVPISIPFPRTS